MGRPLQISGAKPASSRDNDQGQNDESSEAEENTAAHSA
jgi:hypothetical protein